MNGPVSTLGNWCKSCPNGPKVLSTTLLGSSNSLLPIPSEPSIEKPLSGCPPPSTILDWYKPVNLFTFLPSPTIPKAPRALFASPIAVFATSSTPNPSFSSTFGISKFTLPGVVSYTGGFSKSKNVPPVCLGKWTPGTIEPITPAGLNNLFCKIGCWACRTACFKFQMIPLPVSVHLPSLTTSSAVLTTFKAKPPLKIPSSNSELK